MDQRVNRPPETTLPHRALDEIQHHAAQTGSRHRGIDGNRLEAHALGNGANRIGNLAGGQQLGFQQRLAFDDRRSRPAAFNLFRATLSISA